VYDFTVEHEHHNFIADGFVVSNCGVRLVHTSLTEQDVKPVLEKLVWGLFNDVPAGVGSKGDIKISEKEEEELLVDGAGWVVKHGYGIQDDLEHTEERGAIKGADPSAVSERAYERGKKQSGTLGSGNHFLEVQVIDEVYDKDAARALNLDVGQVTVMIHSGSRGLGYQVCDDYVRDMAGCLAKYNINVPDRQLACAPVNSKEGQAYLGAMRCAANYAWANRQCLMHLCRRVFEKIFNRSWEKLGMYLVYDVAHNIAKIEKHSVDAKEKLLCVHRKGATRAFAGQPVIIPGDMGRNSYLLLGTDKAAETFFSTCHGAGRVMSRSEAIRKARGRSISEELAKKGIIVKASGRDSLAEEMSEAYKDVTEVVDVVAGAGISRRVCRMRPLGVIKG
jgi:tRNA-splicing ligase RtcB